MTHDLALSTPESNETRAVVPLAPSGTRDADVIARACAGDVVARREVEQRCVVVLRFMLAIDRRHGGATAREDLEDLAHDALTLALGKLATFSGTSSIETWLYGYCVNVYANDRRRRIRRGDPTSIDSVSPSLVDKGSKEFERTCEQDAVQRALTLLGPPASEVIRLHVFDEMPFPDVSRALNLALGTVKTLYYRGLERLTELLSIR